MLTRSRSQCGLPAYAIMHSVCVDSRMDNMKAAAEGLQHSSPSHPNPTFEITDLTGKRVPVRVVSSRCGIVRYLAFRLNESMQQGIRFQQEWAGVAWMAWSREVPGHDSFVPLHASSRLTCRRHLNHLVHRKKTNSDQKTASIFRQCILVATSAGRW